MSTALTELEVKELAADWYRKLDVHVPMVDILPLLADESLQMKFPESTLNSLASLRAGTRKLFVFSLTKSISSRKSASS